MGVWRYCCMCCVCVCVFICVCMCVHLVHFIVHCIRLPVFLLCALLLSPSCLCSLSGGGGGMGARQCCVSASLHTTLLSCCILMQHVSLCMMHDAWHMVHGEKCMSMVHVDVAWRWCMAMVRGPWCMAHGTSCMRVMHVSSFMAL